ncbi:MAG: hypothetical protein ACXVPQ_01020 [Bacteroidia bacterium]
MLNRLILSLLCACSLSGFSQLDVSTAKWKNNVKTDGFATEWNLPLGFFNSETKLFFAAANDSSTLYLCFQCNDENAQVKINCAGMKVELSSKGKNKFDASVSFPLTDSKSRFAGDDLIAGKTPNISTLKTTFMVQNTNMDLHGFATQNGVMPLKDSAGISAAMNWDQRNVMTYELAIPFKELFGAGFTPADLEKVITLTVEVNGVTKTEESNIDGSSAAMGASSMGATAGMTGGMPGGGGNIKERKPIFDKNKFKEKFKLRTAP